MAQEPRLTAGKEEIEKEILKIDGEILGLERKKISFIQELPIACRECREKSPTKEWTFVQMLYYEEECCGMSHRPPYLCPIICPKCGKERNIEVEGELPLIRRIMKYGANQFFAHVEERREAR